MEERRNIYFLSDFHLGVKGKTSSLEREKKVVRFLQSIENDAKQVFLLGDIFDFWFEYKRVVPKGFVRLLGQLARMTDKGIKVDFFCGNHDLWQRDYFPKEMNITLHREKTKEFVFNGKVFLLGHGDGLDKKDYMYRLLRSIFKNPFYNAVFSCLPSRFGLWVANFWSSTSRGSHNKPRQKGSTIEEPMTMFCKQCLKTKHIDYFILGHRHKVIEEQLEDNSYYLNIGSWLDESPYAVFDGEKIEIKQYDI